MDEEEASHFHLLRREVLVPVAHYGPSPEDEHDDQARIDHDPYSAPEPLVSESTRDEDAREYGREGGDEGPHEVPEGVDGGESRSRGVRISGAVVWDSGRADFTPFGQ